MYVCMYVEWLLTSRRCVLDICTYIYAVVMAVVVFLSIHFDITPWHISKLLDAPMSPRKGRTY